MCGIIGYVGPEGSDVTSILLDGLSKLEYRGYDSAAIGVLTTAGSLELHRHTGKIVSLAAAIEGYKVNIHYWEINDEPNGSAGWNIDANPGSDQAQYDVSVQHFIEDMQDSYVTIHATDPGAKVIFGGLSSDHTARYVDSMIKYDAYRYMDIMAFHPYGDNPQQVLNNLQMLQSKMATQPGFASKPIWITEIGYHTMKNWINNPGYVSSEQKKAQYLVQTIELLRANGAQLVFWYTLHEDDGSNGYGLTKRSLWDPHTVYLPAYTAYKNL